MGPIMFLSLDVKLKKSEGGSAKGSTLETDCSFQSSAANNRNGTTRTARIMFGLQILLLPASLLLWKGIIVFTILYSTKGAENDGKRFSKIGTLHDLLLFLARNLGYRVSDCNTFLLSTLQYKYSYLLLFLARNRGYRVSGCHKLITLPFPSPVPSVSS
jgi:hypothetical protein